MSRHRASAGPLAFGLHTIGPVAIGLLSIGLLAGDASAGSPHVDYMLQCQGCHLADGRGSPGAVPSLVDRIGLFLTVPEGRAFLVQVPGSAQSPLDDAALAGVLNWMIRSYGPARIARDFRPYEAAEVARYRSRPLIDVEARRRELIARIDARPVDTPPATVPNEGTPPAGP